MYVMLRKEMPELRGFLEGRGYKTSVMPGLSLQGFPQALLLVSPSIVDISSELAAISQAERAVRLVVIVEEGEAFLVSTLFPDATVLIRTSRTLRDDIIRGLSGRRAMKDKAPLLTDPEKRLLHMLSFGVSNKELARRLERSERTVRRIKESLYEKTGLVSSEQLMLYSLFRLNTRSS